MICFNCGGPGHYVGNCVKPKACFICQQNHNVNNCAAWSEVQPTAAFFGSGARGLGFYHVDVPIANESKWLNFQNCAVVNILK
uniref:CCHC-type domain-containing protein n=1 Tax=Aegilops tauschii subsp. strangulata TaxID=200361 RepID=A0A453A3S9_AEGTS